jgi:RNA polymerase sigma factor (sigma-70 family)
VVTKSEQSIFTSVVNFIQPFNNAEKLAAALAESDPKAVAFLLEKTTNPIKTLMRSMGQNVDNYRDFQHDGVLILIDKIKNGSYNSTNAAPSTFLVGICKYLILNQLRSKKQHYFQNLAEDFELSDPEEAFYQSSKIMSEMLDDFLEKLGAPCSDLIRLKYLDGFRDEEIIAQKMTHYVSGDSLRNSRSQCMKKLVEIGKKWYTPA